MQFWLKFNNRKETLWLPVNPDTIGVDVTHGYEDVEVSNLGEYTIVGNRRLREFSLSSFFPRDYDASYCQYAKLPDPHEAVATIERWIRSGKPVRFIVTGTPVNLAVTIRSFHYEERGGDPGTLWYTLNMKEHIFVKVAEKTDNKKTSVKNTPPKLTTSAKRPSTVEKTKTYVVKSGDSLFKIAQRADTLGNGDKWRDIYTKNKAIIGANPNVLKPGQRLVIP